MRVDFVRDPLLKSYRSARQEFFSSYGAQWPGILFDAFDILAAFPLCRSEADEILRAAAALGRIYARTAQLLRVLSDEALTQLGVPDHLLPYTRRSIPGMADCVVGRFDLARTEDGYKLLEFNANVPGLMVEAFSVNGAVCRDAQREDPNADSESALVQALNEAVAAGIKYVGKGDHERAHIVVTSAGRCTRDRAIANYLCRLMQPFSAQYALMESLALDAHGLYSPSGDRIDVLYRVFPLQFFRNEVFSPRGTPLCPEMGGEARRLVERRQLAMINPPFSFLLEAKSLQALIWNLAEAGSYFTEEERHLISRYMLPTYLDPPSCNLAHVVKPVYGAEGDTVKVVSAGGRVASRSDCTSLSSQPVVYQKFVEVPALELMTEFGRRTLHVVTSCFLVAGAPTGICMRAGERITDGSAWVMPCSIEPH